MPRFLCKHKLADYVKAALEKGHDPAKWRVTVIRFFLSEDGTVICEVYAPSREAFRKWVASTGYAFTKGETNIIEEA